MAIMNHLTTPGTSDNRHVLTAFFYMKNSKDYPSWQSVSEPFGYDLKKDTDDEINAETPIFGSSMRDLYINYPDLLEVVNNYSSYDDPTNLIPTNEDISLSGTRPRLDRDDDVLSTLLIKNASSDFIFKTIYPNYDAATIDDLKAGLQNESTKPGYVLNPATKQYNYRSCIFWQKVFTLLEYIKRHEAQIYSMEQANIDFPDFFDDNAVGEGHGWYQSHEAARARVKGLGALAKFIAIAIPKLMPTNTGITHLQELEPKRKLFNPVRTRMLAGDAQDISQYNVNVNHKYGEDTDFKDKFTTDIYLEQLWGKLDATPDTDGYDMMFDGLDIRITDLYDISCEFSEHTGRLKKVKFSLSYRHLTDNDTSGNASIDTTNYETWEMNIYFDPDAFIDSDTTSEQFPVWTYNDLDFDNDLRGVDHQYDYKNPQFNKYDNDYANILVPDTEPDGTPIVNSIHGKFVASNDEIEKQFLTAVLEKTKSGGYKSFTTYPVRRVSPYIKDGEVVWDGMNSIDQKFYIFYKNSPPTAEQCNTAVYDYLLRLHSDPNHCHGEHRNPDTGDVEFIGHDPINTAETINFLANMYPSLFEATELYIIPAHYQHCTNGANADLAKYNEPETYFSTTTAKRIYESLTKTRKEFENFAFNPNGAPANSTASSAKIYPVEVFKVGSIEGSDNGSSAFKFDFPWYAVNKGGNLADNCLTTLEGFGDYKQKMFAANHDPTAIADIFQIIMIMLTRQMFTGLSETNMHDPAKERYGNILGIPITYSIDTDKDPTVGTRFFNRASFTINSIKFTVYAQYGKDFGSALAAAKNLTSITTI